MKPKSKLQHRVVELSSKLPALTEKQQAWGFEHCLNNYVVRSRKTLFCLECGHSWKEEGELATALIGRDCPKCAKKLKLYEYYRCGCSDSAYYGILIKKAEFQVVRMFYLRKSMWKTKRPVFLAEEVMQHWIDLEGNVTTMSKRVQGLSRYYDQWIFQSEMEVRPKQVQDSNRYGLAPYKIYPKRSTHPIIKRNGFKGIFYSAPHKFFSLILADPKAETLLKAKQTKLLEHYASGGYNQEAIGELWPSVRICIRNGYQIKKPDIWIDTLKLLKEFGKDLLNPKYVCPEDLDGLHNRLVEKKRVIQRKKRIQEMKEKAEKDQIEYAKKKACFFGLQIVQDNITIRPLESVQEFIIEGDTHGHCVFTNEYYKKDDFLILSAQIETKRIETIEVSLRDLTITQSRGLGNKATRQHNKILKMVHDNMNLIAERIPKTQKRKLKTA